jgi:hypothetical protein
MKAPTLKRIEIPSDFHRSLTNLSIRQHLKFSEVLIDAIDRGIYYSINIETTSPVNKVKGVNIPIESYQKLVDISKKQNINIIDVIVSVIEFGIQDLEEEEWSESPLGIAFEREIMEEIDRMVYCGYGRD